MKKKTFLLCLLFVLFLLLMSFYFYLTFTSFIKNIHFLAVTEFNYNLSKMSAEDFYNMYYSDYFINGSASLDTLQYISDREYRNGNYSMAIYYKLKFLDLIQKTIKLSTTKNVKDSNKVIDSKNIIKDKYEELNFDIADCFFRLYNRKKGLFYLDRAIEMMDHVSKPHFSDIVSFNNVLEEFSNGYGESQNTDNIWGDKETNMLRGIRKYIYLSKNQDKVAVILKKKYGEKWEEEMNSFLTIEDEKIRQLINIEKEKDYCEINVSQYFLKEIETSK